MSTLAPCIAIVGPANSGKTTILHLLDAGLTAMPGAPLAYVLKGNPDGTGRYQYHAPDLRKAFKAQVKGRWTSETPATIGDWISRTRASLELVLLDFGGRHTPENVGMLSKCTHYLAVARRFTDPAEESAEGMESWISACEQAKLTPVAHLDSLWETGDPILGPGLMAGTFRSDASTPGDAMNAAVIAELLARLGRLAIRRPEPPYFDLQMDVRWDPSHVTTLAGRRPRLESHLEGSPSITLGGKAPGWAYAAAAHVALDRRPDAMVWIFDPEVPGAFVQLPARFDSEHGLTEHGFPNDALRLGWSGQTLSIEIATPDKFLPIECVLNLPGLPPPPAYDSRAVPERVVISGALPIWLTVAYTCWARQKGAGEIALFDAGTKSEIVIWREDAG